MTAKDRDVTEEQDPHWYVMFTQSRQIWTWQNWLIKLMLVPNNIRTVIFVHHLMTSTHWSLESLVFYFFERDHELLKLIYDCFQHHPMPTSIRSRSTPVFQPHRFCHRIHSPCFDIKLVFSSMMNHDFLCLIISAYCCFFSIRVPTPQIPRAPRA